MRTQTHASALAIVAFGLGSAGIALADNSPEKAERDSRQDYVPKVNVACGLNLTIHYDGKSLREHNAYIRHDQTDGALVCNEPLRYLYYACKTPAGRAAVQAQRVTQIVCKGAKGNAGAFALDAGTITIEHTENDKAPHERSRKRFEALFGVTLSFGPKAAPDPYDDEEWRELRSEPNPTTSQKDYCLIDGKKQEFIQNIHNRGQYRKGVVKCWKDGEPVIDMEFQGSQELNGFYVEVYGTKTTRHAYKGGKLDGDSSVFDAGRRVSQRMYKAGQVVWEKEFHPSGKLKSYSLRTGRESAGLRQGEDGKLYDLRCSGDVGADRELRTLCGFEREISVTVYDGTGRVNTIATYKNGVLQKQRAGDSAYAERSDVDFVDGKRDGVERILGEDGKLESSITWKRGVKEGKELVYEKGGEKLVRELLWSAGDLKQQTDFYLNGRPKQLDVYDKPDHKQLRTYWDSGKLSSEGGLVRCRNYRGWCEDGLHRRYFESGALEAEDTFKLGRKHGPSKSWWPSGKQASIEEYSDGTRTKSKRWDERGALTADEEYEADGSRKIKP